MRKYSYIDPERSRKVKRFILATLRRRGLRLSKELDQHFVVDRIILKKIVYAVEDISKELGFSPIVYEIGTGIGLLTRELARKRFVYTVDIDINMLQIAKRDVLRDYKNVEFIGADALEFYPPEDYNIIAGNIPYSISGPLIYKLMEDFGRPPAVLTVQKEFADKLTAGCGNRSTTATSVLVSAVYDVRVLGVFPPEAFFPKPKVWSAIIALKPKEPPCNYRILKKIVKQAFTSPNRKLKNLLDIYVPNHLAHKRPRELSMDERCELVSLYIDSNN